MENGCIHSNTFFPETALPVITKLFIEHSRDYQEPASKMAAMTIYGKNFQLLQNFNVDQAQVA